jgi:hypothetical protein
MDLNPPRNFPGGGGGATVGRATWSTVKPMRLSFCTEPVFRLGAGLFRALVEENEAACLTTGEGSASETMESDAKPSKSSSVSATKPRTEAGLTSPSGGEKRDVLADKDVASPRGGGGNCLCSSKDVEPLEMKGRGADERDLEGPALSSAKKDPPFLLCTETGLERFTLMI